MGVNEIQRFDILGSPGQGKFTLTFDHSEPTTQLSYHPAAGEVQTALQALSTIGAGNVTVTKDGNWGYVCAFQNDCGNQNLPLLEADDSLLGGGATIQISVVTEGQPDQSGPTLPMPCTLAELQHYVKTLIPVTPGAEHNVTITNTGSAITASWS